MLPSWFRLEILQQMGSTVTIALALWRVWRSIDRLRGDLTNTVWQHRVMWTHHKKNHRVPMYPAIDFEER